MPKLTGLLRTQDPAPLLAAAIPFRKIKAVPPKFGPSVPLKLSYYGNNQFGDCVSAEEFASKNAYSVWYGRGTELLPTDDECISWARKHGVLNGADLTSVMSWMARDGGSISGSLYHDGPNKSVDWTNDDTLSAAIYAGPVKIAVASSQLSRVHQDHNGWFGTGFHKGGMSDHCVALWGYGSMADLASLCGVSLPSHVNGGDRGYLLYTWSSYGIVDRQSMINITDEAWLRSPTTTETPQTPTDPTPPPPPGPPVPVDPSAPPPPIIVPCGPWNMSVIWEAKHPTPPAPAVSIDVETDFIPIPTPPAGEQA